MSAPPPSDPHLPARLVSVLPVAVVSEDLAHRITSWNPAAERLYGASASEMIGTVTHRLAPPESVDQLREIRSRVLAGEPVEHVDTRLLRPDGRLVTVSLSVAPLRDDAGRVTGLVSSSSDISGRLRTDAELEDARRTLDAANAALTRSNRDLEQFAYVASHDLSEPLRVMTGYVQLIEKRYTDLLDDRGRRYVFHVVDGSRRMRTLIDDLLEYSRFLRQSPDTGVVDGGAVAREVVRRLRTQIDAVGGTVIVHDVPALWSDSSAVTAVLQNLVSNALKFTRPGEAPVIAVAGRRVRGFVELTVDDAGIGIAQEYRERVFRMFSRLHLREEYEGTGIGLAIVQQVAETHGGRAWVEDSPLGGSRFCVLLPAAPVPLPAPRALTASPAALPA